MSENIVSEKSMKLAVRVVRLYQYLSEEKKECILSKQMLRSGTSIGANIKEALQGQSKKDFTAKMSISLKEANETEYWLELLYETNKLSKEQFESIYNDCTEVSKLLTSIVKTSRGNKAEDI